MKKVVMGKLPVVTIVGRTNVGKSTLFNRLAEKVKSITLDEKGVTRDIVKDTVSWNDRVFELIDTGGIDLRKAETEIGSEVSRRALEALNQAKLILFVVDGVSGVLPEDQEISEILRKRNKTTLLLVNKIDVKKVKDSFPEFYTLYHTELITISAGHGLGIADLLDAIVKTIPRPEVGKLMEPVYRVVLLGRPNVGKSSLMNILTKQERALVAVEPGTTREAISESISFYKEPLQITDTPGVRRRRAIKGELEPLMVKSAFRALKNSDIVLLMADASEARLVDQELKLAFYAFEERNRALILLINKIDLMDEVMAYGLERSLSEYKHLMDKITILRISCKTGKNVGKVLPLIKEVWQRYNTKFSDEEISKLFLESVRRKPLMHQRQALEVYSAKQVGVAPPIIVLKVNQPTWFGHSQMRFFNNLLRKKYDLRDVPVKFVAVKR